MKRTDEAIDASRKAVVPGPTFSLRALRPRRPPRRARGQKEEALRRSAASYRKRFPDSDELRFDLERLSSESHIRKLPPEMIRGLFDNYAPLFESHLVRQLAYRGPQLLLDSVLAVDPNLKKCDVLDLGCGTGLCGALFKPLANRLVGIDLAEAMLSRAAARGIYDELLRGDLVPLMADRSAQFDLLLAADVFEYIGDLDEAFAAAHTTLRPQGLFAFTVEKSPGAPLVLQVTHRFAHSLDYLRSLAQQHDFSFLHYEEQTLRLERQNPLRSWVVVLRKSPGSTH